MKALIIYAHPGGQGHCKTILDSVEANLKRIKAEYEVLDLYKMRYDPVLKHSEHYTMGNYKVSTENRKIQAKIKKSDALIFIYPIWWGTTPAILKGFIERVFTPRFAFVYENKIPKGLLKGKQARVFVTSGGPKIFYILMCHPAKRMIKTFTLGFCGIKTKMYQIARCLKLSPEKKEEIRRTVRKAIDSLE